MAAAAVIPTRRAKANPMNLLDVGDDNMMMIVLVPVVGWNTILSFKIC